MFFPSEITFKYKTLHNWRISGPASCHLCGTNDVFVQLLSSKTSTQFCLCVKLMEFKVAKTMMSLRLRRPTLIIMSGRVIIWSKYDFFSLHSALWPTPLILWFYWLCRFWRAVIHRGIPEIRPDSSVVSGTNISSVWRNWKFCLNATWTLTFLFFAFFEAKLVFSHWASMTMAAHMHWACTRQVHVTITVTNRKSSSLTERMTLKYLDLFLFYFWLISLRWLHIS